MLVRDGVKDNGCSTAKPGQVSGTAVFYLNVGASVSLVNETDRTFYFPDIAPVKAMMTILKLPPEGIAVVPFGASNLETSASGEGDFYALANLAFGEDAYAIHESSIPLSLSLEVYTEIRAFSVPQDGIVTGISAARLFFGQTGEDYYKIHAALYQCLPNGNVFTYVAASDVTLSPAFNIDTPTPFVVNGNKTFSLSVSIGTRLAMLVYVKPQTVSSSPANLQGSFNGGIKILFR